MPMPATARVAAAIQRRQAASLELITNALKLQTMTTMPLDPKTKEPWAWDERAWIETRNAELREVIAQTYRDTAVEGYLK